MPCSGDEEDEVVVTNLQRQCESESDDKDKNKGEVHIGSRQGT